MESRGYRHGSESQDSDEPVPPGTGFDDLKLVDSPSTSTPSPVMSASMKGVENAKKRLRAFSIQKKAPVPPVTVVKPVCTGNTTVLIGKLCSVKVNPKPEKPPDDDKKVPKPPKPGGSKKYLNESYSELQKKTLSEIEEMKRKMELVELGIPLGLVCPSTNALPVKAMPTKAMPPIKTFLADSFRVVHATTPKIEKKVKGVKTKPSQKRKTTKVYKDKVKNKCRQCSNSPHNAKIDEIIREARKAKAEGKEFKFDYQKFVPDYDNPFQRKKDQPDQKAEETETAEKKEEEHKKPRSEKDRKDRDKDRRKSARFDRRYDFKRFIPKDHKDRPRERDKREEHRSKDREDKSRERDHKSRDRDDRYKKEDKSDKKGVTVWKDKFDDRKDEKKVASKMTDKPSEKQQEKDGKETDVNLNDYLVCDSWSLDNEGKNSPQVEDKLKKAMEIMKSKKELGKDVTIPIDPLEQLRQSLGKGKTASPKFKMEKLKPVVDSFEFEIDPNDDEIVDIFDEDSNSNKFAKAKSKKDSLYDSPVFIKYDMKKESFSDGMNDETFLESVINEIKLENMSDDESHDLGSHDRGLVEYDESPARDSREPSIGSVTPDLDDSIRAQSQRSDYSDGIKSVDSRKSIESGYKSTESGYKSESKIESHKTDSKFTSSSFKPIEPAKSTDIGLKSDRFKSTLKPVEKSTECRSRSSERHSKSSERTKTEIRSKSESCQKSKSSPQEQRDIFSVERELDEALEAKMSKDTVDSLETWSFVLKICQPLLFRHDKNKCFKETRTAPKLWFTLNPKLCNCVTDRSIVYEELERCKMDLVDRLYGCDQIPEARQVIARTWYPRVERCVVENPSPMTLASEWDLEDDQAKHGDRLPMTPGREDQSLDREYQRFMEAVSWPETSQPSEPRSMTPLRDAGNTKPHQEEKRDGKKMSSEGWSQESEVDEEEKTKTSKADKVKLKEKRKRKRSPSTLSSDSDHVDKKKKKTAKKKDEKKVKSITKRRRLEKKMLKKLKEKKKKKKVEKMEDSDMEEEEEKETKKKDKKVKKKKLLKVKKKAEKKKKRAKSTSTSSSDSSSSSDTTSDSDVITEKKAKRKKKQLEAKKKKKKEKKKKRKQSTSESQSEDLFDVNILNNIKTERLTDDENKQDLARKHREIINVKQLQDDFSSTVQIKQEIEEESNKVQPTEVLSKPTEALNDNKVVDDEDEKAKEEEVQKKAEEPSKKVVEVPKKVKEVTSKVDKVCNKVEVKTVESTAELMNRFDLDDNDTYSAVEVKIDKVEFKEPEVPTPPPRVDDTSQCSSQESVQSITSVKEPAYEKDDSHLRPSCDNSNYSFNDVINSQSEYKNMEEKFEGYENYEIYEQMAMAYQSDVASQQISPPSSLGEQRIETVVRARNRGEIKCDWRASDGPAPGGTHRPSRWGLKPGEVNIVLTGGSARDPRLTDSTQQRPTQQPPAQQPPAQQPPAQPVYQIQSLANRGDTSSMGYDEAYMDTYGAADRLQYGDCFAPAPPPPPRAAPAPAPRSRRSARSGRSLDDRIHRVLQGSGLGEVAKDDGDKEKGILVTAPSPAPAPAPCPAAGARGCKRVRFADGYAPGQDSDTEDPPLLKRKKSRRVRTRMGCAWPCPATHPDHVPLWDALPPPPPPPGSPPPPAAPAPPAHLLRGRQYNPPALHPPPPHTDLNKYGPGAGGGTALSGFMPPEPPPGLISFP